jgi:hypothetical protein
MDLSACQFLENQPLVNAICVCEMQRKTLQAHPFTSGGEVFVSLLGLFEDRNRAENRETSAPLNH